MSSRYVLYKFMCMLSQYSDLDLLIDIYRPLSNLHEIVNKLHMQGEQKL